MKSSQLTKNNYSLELNDISFSEDIDIRHKIKNLSTFLEYYKNKGDGNVHGRYYKIYDAIKNLSPHIHTDTDPIVFLYYLYFKLELTYDEIHNLTCAYTGYSSIESTRNLFVDIFHWPSRDKNKRTERNLEKRNAYTVRSINEALNKTRTIIDNIIEYTSSNPYSFDADTFESKETIVCKILYFCSLIFKTNEDQALEHLHELLNTPGISSVSLTKVLQENIDYLIKNSEIEFTIKTNNVRYIKDNKTLKK